MRLFAVKTMTSTVLLSLVTLAAVAELPKRDLTIALRQVTEGEEAPKNVAGYSVSTRPREAGFAPQQVRVRNGEKAILRMEQSMPMLWVQKMESASATLSAASASASSQSGGITQALTWMEAGQTLSVTPNWPGGNRAAKLEIEVQSSAVDERVGSDLPATQRQHLSTTISAPLNQWVTIATSGHAAAPGSYSSTGSQDTLHLVQIRVSPN